MHIDICQRCGGGTENVTTMSWFTEEIVCMSCKDAEKLIREKLPAHGLEFEGCGYIPKV